MSAGEAPAEAESSDLVPEPGSGRVYRHEIRPGIADAGGDRRVRIDSIARWLQDLAHLDLRDAGFRERGIWIVRRLRLRVEAWPRWPERLELRTFCSGLGRFMAERRTSIVGREGRIEAVALWVWLDAETLRPRRFPPEFVDLYAESAAGREPTSRLRHPDPPPDAMSRPWRFRATDVDVAAHVNNSNYWAPLEEELAEAGAAPAALDAEIEFRDAAQPGDAVVLSDGPMRWIASETGTVFASIQIAR